LKNEYFLYPPILIFDLAVNLKVYLSDLQVGETVDEWQNMYPANVSPRVEAAGSLRVRSRYQHEVIMPLKEYTSLKEVRLT